MSKPIIVHMVEAYEKVGGPPRLVRLIITSSLRDQYDFRVLSYSISGFDLRALFGLRRQLARLKPALAHIHGLKSDGFLATVAAKLARVCPVLLTIHGSSLDSIADYRGLRQKLRRWTIGHLLEPATLRLADAVYCVCDAMKNQSRIRRHAGARLQETIHNGVRVSRAHRETDGLREAFGFGEEDVVLLYTGRITWDKGLGVLATAMKGIVREESTHAPYPGGKLKLLLAGDGPAFNEVRACFQPLIQANRVMMAGRRDDIEDLNAMADLFVFPSLHENLPFSLLEAMNAGRAVVATGVGGNSEVVAHGQTGLLVPPHDVPALAEAILQLAADRDLRNTMGEAGRQRLATRFSAETVHRRTGALYGTLLSGRKQVTTAPAPRGVSGNLGRRLPAGS